MADDVTSILTFVLNSVSAVSLSSVSLVLHSGDIVAYNKGDIVFPEKKYNAFEYFQLEGITHRYNKDTKGEYITTGLYVDATVITPHFSRTTDSLSIFSLQALSDCTFLKVPIGAFNDLRARNEQVRTFGQRVVEREFIKLLHYEVLFRSYSARDRLLFFRATFPSLENKISHTVIASFLGITPQSFSRLRNDLSKAK
jgi:hypothetical protein